MNFSLNTNYVEPALQEDPKSIIIMCHGFGGDGNDIKILAESWKRFLPNTGFYCPNAPEICSVNPNGFQWFDLMGDNKNLIIEKSITAEKILNSFINEILDQHRISKKSLCLVGFSQGCMIILQTAIKQRDKMNCIVGFSGKIIDEDHLKKNFFSKQNIFLLHGDKDTVVPTSHLLEAKLFFSRMGNKIKTKILKNCEHRISVEASSLALEFIKKNISIK